MKRKILTVSLLVVVLLSILVTPAIASSQLLESTGAIGTSNADEIVIAVPTGTTLGDIESLSWLAYVVEGYAPHADIRIDTSETPDGVADDAIVFEYAYNTPVHYAEPGGMPYGVATGSWFPTFGDDEDGIDAIDGAAFGWLSSGAPGPYPDGAGFVGGTLDQWKTGINGIDANTPVVNIHIETDNWVVDTVAIVDDVNLLLTGGTSVGMTATMTGATEPDIVAVSVDKASLNFSVTRGAPETTSDSNVEVLTITNTGTVDVVVSATLVDADPIFDYLTLDSSAVASFGPTVPVGGNHPTSAQLVSVPAEALDGTGTLVFEAIGVAP